MDAISLLKTDHKELRGMFKEMSGTTKRGAKARADLLAKIGLELFLHSKVEEEIFYPAFKQAAENDKDSRIFFEAMEEHHAVDDLVLPDLKHTDVATDQFGARAKVLKELVEHHMQEEEGDMFPRAKTLLGKDELDTLGTAMEARKKQLKAARKSEGK